VNICTQHLTISRVERDSAAEGSASDLQQQSRFRSRLERLGGPLCPSYRGSKPVAATHRASARKSTVPSAEASGKRQLIGIADLLAPHPRGDHATLGLLILHRARQGKGLGREAAGAIENVLSSEGWMEVEVVVQRVRPRSRRFWERCGYRLTAEGTNENGLPCWILRKRPPVGKLKTRQCALVVRSQS
jgi:hypothetical protein